MHITDLKLDSSSIHETEKFLVITSQEHREALQKEAVRQEAERLKRLLSQDPFYKNRDEGTWMRMAQSYLPVCLRNP